MMLKVLEGAITGVAMLVLAHWCGVPITWRLLVFGTALVAVSDIVAYWLRQEVANIEGSNDGRPK
jgi:hypothetical protein